MKKNRARSLAALAGALSLGSAVVPVGIAGAATTPRPSAPATATTAAGTVSAVARAGPTSCRTHPVRSVSDGAFRMARTILRADGSDHIVFTATDLRTGRTLVLTG
jgi:hypothetical protein